MNSNGFCDHVKENFFCHSCIRWHPSGDDLPLVGPILKNWLLDKNSLTTKLKNISNNFEVKLASSSFGLMHSTESDVLGLPQKSAGWVREVNLVVDGSNWVFARSIIAGCDDHTDSKFFHLGNSSLGSLLFGPSPYKRSEVQVGHYVADAFRSHTSDGLSWARRSVFSRRNSRILVQELFLPELLNRIKI